MLRSIRKLVLECGKNRKHSDSADSKGFQNPPGLIHTTAIIQDQDSPKSNLAIAQWYKVRKK